MDYTRIEPKRAGRQIRRRIYAPCIIEEAYLTDARANNGTAEGYGEGALARANPPMPEPITKTGSRNSGTAGYRRGTQIETRSWKSCAQDT